MTVLRALGIFHQVIHESYVKVFGEEENLDSFDGCLFIIFTYFTIWADAMWIWCLPIQHNAFNPKEDNHV